MILYQSPTFQGKPFTPRNEPFEDTTARMIAYRHAVVAGLYRECDQEITCESCPLFKKCIYRTRP